MAVVIVRVEQDKRWDICKHDGRPCIHVGFSSPFSDLVKIPCKHGGGFSDEETK